MTRNEILRRFPHAKESFIKLNLDPDNSGICAIDQKPTERSPLGGSIQGEEACWHDASTSFEVTYTVYAVKPADYDGYDIKALQDFLCTAGIIPNDGWKTLSGRVVSRKAESADKERTEITITTTQQNLCS